MLLDNVMPGRGGCFRNERIYQDDMFQRGSRCVRHSLKGFIVFWE
jgi:hypothetical protein